MEAYIRAGQVSTTADQVVATGEHTWKSVVAAAAVSPAQLATMRASKAEENYLDALADVKEGGTSATEAERRRIVAAALWAKSGAHAYRCTWL